jgi:hypothetical protein
MMVALAGFTVACFSDTEVGTPPPLGPKDSLVNAIMVAPDHLSLAPGHTMLLGASVDAGRFVTDRSVIWTSSDTTIATVSTAGHPERRGLRRVTSSRDVR